MPLPFDLEALLTDEYFAIGSLNIPKYGSLTPKEFKVLNAYMDDETVVTQADYALGVVSEIAALRCDVAKETFDDVPRHLINGAYEFILNESREWKTEEVTPEPTEGKSIGSISTLDSDLTTPMPSSGIAPLTWSELPSNLPTAEI